MTGPPPKFRPLRDEITDLPNLITIARIALIPVILVLIDNNDRQRSLIAFLVFAVAASTDMLDGYLARRLNLVTVVGKFLDPLADKLIVLSTLIVLIGHDRVPPWLVVVLMSREIAITGLRAIASQEGFVIAAGAGGKIKTILQLVGLCFLLAHFPYDIPGTPWTLDAHLVGTYLIYASLVMSVISAFEYFRFFVNAATKQAEELAQQGISRAQRVEELRANRRVKRERRQSKRDARRQQRLDKIAGRRGAARRQRRGKTRPE